MGKYLLEVCVDSVESAIEAELGGADRVELCNSLITGGITPGIALYKEVLKHVTIPVKVLIRPRMGDFLYTNSEYEIMKNEVLMFREMKAYGAVLGCLKADGKMDINRLTKFLTLARDMKITVNRAFDMLINPLETLEELKQLQVDSILTSGQKNSCLEGMGFIQELIEQSENRVNILVGGGVNASVIDEFTRETAATHFHMSGKTVLSSSMKYKKEEVHMGLPFFSEYEIIRTKREFIEAAKSVLMERKMGDVEND